MSPHSRSEKKCEVEFPVPFLDLYTLFLPSCDETVLNTLTQLSRKHTKLYTMNNANASGQSLDCYHDYPVLYFSPSSGAIGKFITSFVLPF